MIEFVKSIFRLLFGRRKTDEKIKAAGDDILDFIDNND